MRRVRRVPGPVTVARQRVYILPTRQGVVFGVMAFALLLGSMNYSNSLGFMLTFLLGGLGLVGMHHTHRNLVNLRVAAGGGQPAFAGESIAFAVRLDNPSNTPRYALAVSLEQGDWPDRHADVPAQGSGEAVLDVPAPRRGRVNAPRFTVSTRFPLGLFYAWTWVELDMASLAYPQPAGSRLPELPQGEDGPHRTTNERGDDDFAGVRSYQRGDALNTIHWRVSARTGELVVKQLARARQDEVMLDFDTLTDPDPEARLSQLARWVLDAEARGLRWSLRLPDAQIPADGGRGQATRCLTALALHGRH